jgi:acetyl esterase
MPSLDDRPPVDAILQKVLDAVPFQLSVDGGIKEARRRLRELPRRPVHPDLRVESHEIDGPGGPIPVRVYWPDDVMDPPATTRCVTTVPATPSCSPRPV